MKYVLYGKLTDDEWVKVFKKISKIAQKTKMYISKIDLRKNYKDLHHPHTIIHLKKKEKGNGQWTQTDRKIRKENVA